MGLPGLNQYQARICLAQGHKAVTTMRLEPAIPRFRVKHSATEPLHSLLKFSVLEVYINDLYIVNHMNGMRVLMFYGTNCTCVV